MFSNFKHYAQLTLTTFLGPAERGTESVGDYLRRKREEERRSPAEERSVDKVLTANAPQPDYVI